MNRLLLPLSLTGLFVFGASIAAEVRASDLTVYGSEWIKHTDAFLCMEMYNSSVPGNPATLFLRRSKGATVDTLTAVSDGTLLGKYEMQGYDGSAWTKGALWYAMVDGTPGAGDMPGKLVFATTPDGGNDSVARMTIKSSGRVGINTTTPNYQLEVSGDINAIGYVRSNGTILTSSRGFKRNITPVFCQFGMAYGDYDSAFFGDNTTKYLYAFSTHDSWWNQDNLYLGRAMVYYSEGWHLLEDTILAADKWEYWVGTGQDGQPLWSSDVLKAAPILHSKGEIAQPSVIYHKDSGRYLMATFSNSGNNTLDGWPNQRICPDSLASTSTPVGGQKDPHWILWQAPKPWGPWKKAFTNDYNGLQTDYLYPDPYSQNRQGFEGYNVQIMPAWTSSSGVGEWSIWVLHAGFRNFLGGAVLDFGGGILVEHPYKDSLDWLEGYTMQFSQIALSQKTKPISASLSPMYQHEQNNTPVVPASTITVGYHFQLAEARTVTHLGRYFVTGNSGTHTLKIASVRVIGTTADQPTYVASKTLNLGTGGFTPDQMDENGFVYVKLDSPVQLSANTHYLLLSTEGGTGADTVFGGRSNWANGVYDIDPDPDEETYALENVVDLPEVSAGSVLQVLDGAIERLPPNTNTWTLLHDGSWSESDLGKTEVETGIYGVPLSGVGGNAYGALNLLLQQDSAKAPYAMHSAQSASPPSPALSQNEHLVGTRFTMASDAIVSALGRMKVSGNAKVHEVRLMLDNGGNSYTTIASVPVRMYTATANEAYVYRDLATPVRLGSGKTYVLVSREFYNVGENYCGESDMTYDQKLDQTVFTNSASCWLVWNANGVGERTDGSSHTCLGGVNLKYH